MFDKEGLVVILSEAGFKNVRIREFNENLDLDSSRKESIYAEGEKI